MTHRSVLLFLALILVAGCASEDPNIVNPPPGNSNVLVRLFNMVPDDKSRLLLMELDYQTQSVPPGLFSAAVDSPGDSSFLEIITQGATEYRSPNRQRFVRSSVYDIFAVAAPDGSAFDTIMVSNANASLTTQPVAQLRVLNTYPDTSLSYDVRVGCPNGPAITPTPLRFRSATLYNELPPGLNVISISENGPAGLRTLGTYQCILEERTPYTLLLHPLPGESAVQLMLYSEADFTANAQRTLAPVAMRDADIRVMNLSASSASVTLTRTGQQIVSNLPPSQLGSYESVPTCESSAADVLECTFDDNRKAVDSTSLTVRGRYTVITADDSLGQADIIIVPPHEPAFGRAGKAVVRVVSAYSKEDLRVSIAARTDEGSSSGFTSGKSLTSQIHYGEISALSIVDPGEVPVIISTFKTPTTTRAICRLNLEADHDYILTVASDGNDGLEFYAIDEDDQAGVLQNAERAAIMSFVNGGTDADLTTVFVGSVISNARLYYRNSFSTNVPFGSVAVNAGGTGTMVTTSNGNRTLAVYAVHSGSERIFEITSTPLSTKAGQTQRRVINATADVPFVSVTYDTSYKDRVDTLHVASNVAFGTTSPIETIYQVNRGSLYVYDSQTKEAMFTLPNDIGPIGNSYSLIVVGKRQQGYEVIVLQEF